MKIKDGEIVFGKHWNLWSESEKTEFARVLDPEDLNTALTLNWALKYAGFLPSPTLAHLQGLMERAMEEKR